MRELDPALTARQKNNIQQIVATLELEDLQVPESAIRKLEDLALGRATVEQIIAGLDRRYQR